MWPKHSSDVAQISSEGPDHDPNVARMSSPLACQGHSDCWDKDTLQTSEVIDNYLFIAERKPMELDATGSQPAPGGHCPSLHWKRGERSRVLLGDWGDHKSVLQLEEKSQLGCFFTSCLVIYTGVSSSR